MHISHSCNHGCVAPSIHPAASLKPKLLCYMPKMLYAVQTWLPSAKNNRSNTCQTRFCSSRPCPPCSRPTHCRFAVKSMPKRFASAGHLEPYYVRRVRNEVDICNHLGRCASFNVPAATTHGASTACCANGTGGC